MSDRSSAALPGRATQNSAETPAASSARGRTERITNKEMWAILKDVALSGVEMQDPRLSYVVVQVDVDTWRRLTAIFGPEHGHGEVAAVPATRTVHWYEHDCRWQTKLCDEEHLKAAVVPLSVLKQYEVRCSGQGASDV